MKYSTIECEVKGKIALININRVNKGNSFNKEMVLEFTDFFKNARSELGIYVVVITTRNEKYFSCGADIDEMFSNDIIGNRSSFEFLAELYETIRTSPIVTISAVNGLAIGAGCGLAAVSDMVIATQNAKFGLPEIRIGLAPLVVLIPLIRVIGHKKAMLLALEGELIDATRAHDLGLVDCLVTDSSELHEESLRIAENFASSSNVTLIQIKKSMLDADVFDYKTYYEYMVNALTCQMLNNETKAVLDEYRNKKLAKKQKR